MIADYPELSINLFCIEKLSSFPFNKRLFTLDFRLGIDCIGRIVGGGIEDVFKA